MKIIRESIHNRKVRLSEVVEEREDKFYRRLTQTSRDLAPIKQDKMIDVAFYLYQRNGMAKRHIDLLVQNVLSGGIKYNAEDDKVKEVLDMHWKDPVNQWDLKQDSRVRELSLTGEQFYRVFRNVKNGLLRLGSIDPKEIHHIMPNPENVEELEYVFLKSDKSKPIKIISYDKRDFTNEYGVKKLNDGEIFVFQINKVLYQTRGISDLLTVADWYDMHDKTAWTIAERVPFLLAFLWDVKLINADEEQVFEKARQLKNNPPFPGTSRVHSENEEWQAISPDLNASDLKDVMRLIKLVGLTGSGFPVHWFSEGEETNRATAAEMTEPVMKMLINRQKYIKYMIRQIFDMQLHSSIQAGWLKSKNLNYEIIIPSPDNIDKEKVTNMIERLMNGLQLAISQKLLSKKTSREIIINSISELGQKINVEDEVKKIEDEESESPELDKAARIIRDERKTEQEENKNK